LPIFRQALRDIYSFLTNNEKIVDFYSGVGLISLPIAAKNKKITLVDVNREAIEFARENIKINNLTNCEAVCSSAESVVDFITSDKTIIFDPPRAGLDKIIIERIIEMLPEKIIYLSCDPATQARDLGKLKDFYNIKFFKLYNFFPRTPHIESLIILFKK
jgi:23S rRNA (uracil1939-C5)-methyltransferase